MSTSAYTCTDPLSALPINTTRYAGQCGVVTNSTSNLVANAVLRCAAPCYGAASFEPCVLVSGAADTIYKDSSGKHCARAGSIGISGVAEYNRCLAREGLDVYNSSNGVIDTFCVESKGVNGLRQPGGLSSDAKIGIGVGVGLGVPLLILMILSTVFFVKLRKARRQPAAVKAVG